MAISEVEWQWLQQYRPAIYAELKLQGVTEMVITGTTLGHETCMSFPQLQPRRGMLPIFDRNKDGQLCFTFDWRTLERQGETQTPLAHVEVPILRDERHPDSGANAAPPSVPPL